MNYQHIYHAGNFADILKHLVLCFCLEKLCEKDAPFFVLDTHAGIAKYDLSDEKALKTGENIEGIKKLLADENFVNYLPEKYLKILAKINNCQIEELPKKLEIYAGSPLIIENYLRPQDRAFFAELNQKAFLELRKNFAYKNQLFFLQEDGFSLLKSTLPPLEKRGLIVIDPAFEKDQSKISIDWKKIISSLIDASKRFQNGIYLIWYPIIEGDEEVLQNFYQEIDELNFSKILRVTIDLKNKVGESKMQSCGVFVINFPWQLDEKLKVILPKILAILKNSNEANFTLKV